MGEGGQRPRKQSDSGWDLRQFDVFAKLHDEYKVKTSSGGFLSVGAMMLMAFLFVAELNTFLTVEVVDHILVDTTLAKKLPIGLNITFPHLRCDEVSVDTVDAVGENQVNIQGRLHKVNLGLTGQQSEGDHQAKAGECMSCMEAADDDHKCCNTCQALKDAYADAKLSYYHILDTAEQCRDAVGCQVHGDVSVNKVGGNVHVALGKSTIKDGKHVHEFNIKDVEDGFNTSHSIHRLTFGEPAPGVESPLEGTSRVVLKGAGMFHYYVKLVPTLYVKADGTKTYSNQYAVTQTAKNVMVKQGELTGLPGVFFVYEFNPFLIQKEEREVAFTSFLTSVSAIIGGTFTISRLVDTVIFSSMCAMMGAPPRTV
mmetsp:Transcript_36992/g.80847  ORF Transcript_36992/g.80847 Transcript_36992/m.80847 type:complete len:369 (+) Transcript_36992:40-1146(+)